MFIFVCFFVKNHPTNSRIRYISDSYIYINVWVVKLEKMYLYASANVRKLLLTLPGRDCVDVYDNLLKYWPSRRWPGNDEFPQTPLPPQRYYRKPSERDLSVGREKHFDAERVCKRMPKRMSITVDFGVNTWFTTEQWTRRTQ